jgi:anti-sigma factor RsiW
VALPTYLGTPKQDPMHDQIPPNLSTAHCATIRALIDDVVAGASDATLVSRVEAHVSTCPPCRVALAAARAYQRAMRRVGRAVRASQALRQRAVNLLRDVRGTQAN